MKIVTRTEFLKLPPGTLYSKYTPCVFDDLHIKGESLTNDWYAQQIADAIEFHDSGQFCDDLERARLTGCSLKMDFQCEGRDGLYDADQLFAVWERQDVETLIARLHATLQQT